MNDISDILLVCLAVVAVSFFIFRKSEPAPKSGAATPTTAQVKPTLAIDGTEPLALTKAQFFAGFGVPVRRLLDARVFRGVGNLDELPKAVAAAVRKLYADGTAMGLDIAQLAHERAALSNGQAVYFALAQTGRNPQDVTLYAFVDRNRG